MDLEKLRRKLEQAANSTAECRNNEFKIDVVILNEDKINASASKIEDKHYLIYIYEGTFDRIKNLIDFYLFHIIEKDIEYLNFEDSDSFFRLFDGDDKITKFKNHLGLMIINFLLCHELGHIFLGHCDEIDFENLEIDDSKDAVDYKQKTMEMEADWFGLAKCLSVNLFSNPEFRGQIKLRECKDYRIIKKEIFSLYVAAFICFTAFSIKDNPYEKVDIKNVDFQKGTHPHPLVRLAYSLDAITDSAAAILSEKTKETYDFCYQYVLDIFNLTNLEKFLTGRNTYSYLELFNYREIVLEYCVLRREKMLLNLTKARYTKFEIVPFKMEYVASWITEMMFEEIINNHNDFFK